MQSKMPTSTHASDYFREGRKVGNYGDCGSCCCGVDDDEDNDGDGGGDETLCLGLVDSFIEAV